MFERGISEFGGMPFFVKKGCSVVIKPNIAWDTKPELAACTNPELVACIVRHCLRAGAASVSVFDTTCDDWRSSYETSGIARAARLAGAEVVGGDSAGDRDYFKNNYLKVKVARGKVIKEMNIHRLVELSDVFINVPVLKHHRGAGMSCAMKNMMGTVSKSDQTRFHLKGLQQAIADCNSYRRPDLTVVDAYRVLFKRGPRGVDASDTRLIKYQLIGRDLVALDAAAARILDLDPGGIEHIKLGEAMGLGSTDLKSMDIRRIVL